MPLSSDVTFPSSSRYQSQVAAWVKFQPQNFSTLPDARVEAKLVGGNGSIILPLQRYSSPNSANYEDVEPSGAEMLLQGARDVFSGGGIGKLMAVAAHTIPIGPGGTNLSDMLNFGAGLKGAALLDISHSDLMFKNSAKRVHAFSFSLYAKNAQDAENLDYIADTFQTRMYPFFETRTGQKATPPDMWKIQIVPSAGSDKSFVLKNSIQPSVLVNCTVSRMDSTAPVLTTNNYFLGLDISISFSEIEPAYQSYKSYGNGLFSRNAAGSGTII
jgi:hypothetical protein